MKLNLSLSKSRNLLPKTLLLCSFLACSTIIYGEGNENILAEDNNFVKTNGIQIGTTSCPKFFTSI